MVAFDITERVIQYLGVPTGTTATWVNSNFQYDYAIAGVPFVSAINDIKMYLRAPYKRSLAPVRRDQVDQQPTPGEQSLAGWWLRSQSNWTGGAGIAYFEPATDDRTMRRFKDSLGVDCWTAGQVTLLNATTASASVAGRAWPVSYAAGSATYYVYGSGASAVINRAGSTTALTSASPLAVTDDGISFYRLTTTGLFKGTIAGAAGDSAFYTTQPTPATGTIAYVKSRLMYAINNSIYEQGVNVTIPVAAIPASATYTHPNSSWVWSSICDGPSAVYAAGSAGSRSAIYKFALDTSMSSSSLPAITRGTVAAELPTGEIINSISTYLGRYMAVCTNKGVRVAVIDGNGDLTYGPLIWTDAACYSSFGSDRFFFIGTTLSSGPGLVRIDLSDPAPDGRFPYATDLQSGVSGSGYVTSICQIGTSALKSFTTFDNTNSYRIEESSNKIASGWIRSGQVRYSTLEPKHYELVSLRWASPMDGTVGVSSISSSGTEVSIATVGSASDQNVDMQWPSTAGAVGYGVRLDLNRSGSDATKAPVVQGWQLKAVPAATRKEMVELPVLCFDFVRDRYDVSLGYEGMAMDMFSLLKSKIIDGSVVTFQDLGAGESLSVVIEDLDFEQVTPPGIASGFGGVLTVTMRQV